MPLSIFRKLGLGEANPITTTLQLADRSLTHHLGIIEDVLVKVDKFIFPADFIVLEMEEDKEVPIILGRPFLGTGWALIDVQKGELRLRVQDEEVTFKVFNVIKHPMECESCFRVDIVEVIVISQKDHIDPLETSLIYGDSPNIVDEKAREFVLWMDSFGQNKRKYFEILGSSYSRLITLIENPRFLKRNSFHLTLGMLTLGSLLPYRSLSLLISLKWKRNK